MHQPNVYEVVGRYLHSEISRAELRGWLLDSWAWFDAGTPDERELATVATHFGWILEDGEWTEDAFRRELEREYHKALKQRPEPVS